MTRDELRDQCLGKPGTSSDFPFDQETEVFRLQGKIFALCATNQSERFKVNLKCDPDLAIDMRHSYPDEVLAGYHMNHRHWNTVTINGSIPDEKISWMIEHSYECVKAKLPKRSSKSKADSAN